MAQTTTPQPGLIDITPPVRKAGPVGFLRSLTRALLIGLPGALAGAFIALRAASARSVTVGLWWFPVFVILGGAFAMWRRVRRSRICLAALERDVRAHGLAAALTTHRDAWSANGLRAAGVCHRLAQIGCVGYVLRVRTMAPTPVEPLAVPFEACRLDDDDPAFRALAEGTGTSPALAAAAGRRRRRERWLIAFGALFLVALAAALALGSRRGILGLATLLGLLLPFAGLMLFVASRAPCWLIVPGGVVLRRIPLWGPTRLYLFKHDASTLIVTGYHKSFVVVADAQKSAVRLASAREAEFLLRAWFSPLAPPSAEQLDGLR